MSILIQIQTLLATANVSTSVFPCKIGYLPDSPDQGIGLAPSGGSPQTTHGGETTNGSFQIKIRTAPYEYELCIAKWSAVFNAIQDAEGSLTDVYLLQAINSEPIVWYDDKNRPCASLNCRFIQKKP